MAKVDELNPLGQPLRIFRANINKGKSSLYFQLFLKNKTLIKQKSGLKPKLLTHNHMIIIKAITNKVISSIHIKYKYNNVYIHKISWGLGNSYNLKELK